MDTKVNKNRSYCCKEGDDLDVEQPGRQVSCHHPTGTPNALFRHATVPNAVLQVADCQVTKNIKAPKPDHTVYHAVQVAAVNKPAKAVTRQMLGHFKKANILPKRYVKEFPVTSDAHLPVGTPQPSFMWTESLTNLRNHTQRYSFCSRSICRLCCDLVCPFYALQFPMPSHRPCSIGKGFQGTMKKWGFGGLAASHGVSVSHRSAGSTGQHQASQLVRSALLSLF